MTYLRRFWVAWVLRHAERPLELLALADCVSPPFMEGAEVV
jgi:hypothetical protein